VSPLQLGPPSEVALGGTVEGPPLGWPLLAGAAVLLVALLLLIARGQSAGDFLLGLRLGLSGLVTKELRSRSRGWRPVLVLTGYLLLLSGGVLGFLYLVRLGMGVVPPTLGSQLFSTLALGAVVLLSFIAPALTAGAVSGERERRTLDLLLVTRASALGLVVGKLLGSLMYALFLLSASLPAFALVYLYGGVPPSYLLMVFLVAVVTALTHAAVALFLSALLRRTLATLVLSYMLVLGVVFGVPFVSGIANVTGQMQMSSRAMPMSGPVARSAVLEPAWYSYVSPVVSLASVLPAGSPDVDLVGAVMRGVLIPGGGFAPQPSGLPLWRRQYVVGIDTATGRAETIVGWAPWVYHFLLSGIASIFCVLVSALSVAPIKPWRAAALRARRRRAVTASA
jgi:ABC-type transport system involved in multi-copper enzyme maturation permease subunit